MRAPRPSGARPIVPRRVARIEDARALMSIAPLSVCECVDAEMKKERKLVALPNRAALAMDADER